MTGSRALLVNRMIVSVHAVAIIGQPVFAGGYLSGDYDMLWPHRWGADVVSALGYAQVLAALVLWWVRGPRWLSVVSVLVAAGETVQYFAGLDGALDLHLPLGVALVTAMVLTTVAVWRPQVRRAAR
ncbi:hypothetical protein SAMN05444920_11947 [Nonomuraea solani]|uniref:DoxX-like family protein n=2 Tax=Nonomuraea solani TaxID=1144553 RepID=A0A1H6ETB6_9ACTN|nr:hypothetical protein SAMN05444920_11947 [Nonomuraea solani]